MKLTLRDLFWLLLLAAGLTAWVLQHQRNAEHYRRAKVHSRWRTKDRNLPPTLDAIARRKALARLEKLDNAQLDAHFAAVSTIGVRRHADYEPCLAVMSRQAMADELQRHYDHLMSQERDPNEWPFLDPENLELLTALRRAQRQPDPLHLQVTTADRDLVGNVAPPTMIAVRITNRDVEEEPAYFVFGGDNSGGRRERWRVLLTDEEGRAVGDSNFASLVVRGGGIFSFGPLSIGESGGQEVRFDLRRYVSPPKSGKYQLQVLYHNSYRIADEPDHTGLIVMKSQPIAVWVDNPASERRWVFGPELVPMLAIAVAGAGLAGAARVRGKRLARRDLVWAGLITCVVFSFWLDHCHQLQRIADLQPDAEAQWSIRLTPPN